MLYIITSLVTENQNNTFSIIGATEDKKNALRVYKFVGSDFGDGYIKEEFGLDEYWTDTEGRSWKNHYYLLFTPKNRRGQSNDTGLDVLVLRANHAFNTWSEVGWTSIANNRS